MGKFRKIIIPAAILTAFVMAASAMDTGKTNDAPVGLEGDSVQAATVYARTEPSGDVPPCGVSKNASLVAQSGQVQLYLDKKSGAVEVLNQANGYVWSSIPQNDKLSGMNQSWKGFARSLIAVDYVNADGKATRLSSNLADDIQYEEISNGFRMTAKFDEEGVTVGADVTLNSGSLRVKVAKGVVKDNAEHRVCGVYVMPFFGAVREDSLPGYSFVPDGCGALIRFGKQKSYVSPYMAAIYGDDAGTQHIQKGDTVEAKKVSLPVYGMTHGERANAFLAVAESGAAYGKILSYPSGVITPFNWTCFSFDYLNAYFQKTDRQNGGYSTYSKTRNQFDLCVSYTFLSGNSATYTGMAVKYRTMLQAAGELPKAAGQSGEMPLRIEAVMAETTPSVLGTRVVGMTTAGNVMQWVTQLSGAGVKRLTVSLAGWEKGGLDGHKLSQTSPDPRTGSVSDYESLIGQTQKTGGSVYFVKNEMAGYENQLDMNQNGIINIDGSVASITDSTAPMYQTLYFNNIRAIQSLAGAVSRSSFLEDKNIALEEMPSRLYSDYNKKMPVTKEEALDGMRSAMSAVPAQRQAVFDPNSYAFRYASAVFNTPVSGSGYLYALEYVPFLETLLSGSSEMYAPYCNFIINSKADVLRLIDFDVYPSFILTQQPSYLFAKTNMNNIYSSAFKDWNQNIIEVWGQMSPLLSKVAGKSILDRTTPQDGLTVVTYEGNVKIGINYTSRSVTYAGCTLAPLSAVVLDSAAK